MLRWSIYLLRDPRDGAVRYVGWCRDPAQRLRDHLKEARRRNKHHRANWIRLLASLRLVPTLHVVQRGSGDGWADAERRWISRMRSIGCDLVNATDGGDGVPGLRHTEAARRRMSEQRTGVAKPVLRGRPLTRAHREKLSQAKRGRPLAPEHRRKIALALIGGTRTDATRAKMSASQKRRGPRGPHTVETRAKMSASQKRRWASAPIPSPHGNESNCIGAVS